MPISESADLTLFYAPQSRAATALRFMEELDQPYRLEVIDLNKGDQKKPEFLRRNPMGKVPLALDGDVAVAETGAIFSYLADKYAPGRLAPRPDEPERADYLRWLFFAAGVMEPAYGQKFFNWEVPSRQAGWGSYDQMLEVVTEAVGSREWLAGSFSAADIYVASTLRYGILFGIIPNEGPVADYVNRWSDRPATKRAAEIDERLIAEHSAASPS
ncbi:MAG: glutathione S-transferase family protein [Pseudomonadota bacterium]|nr:glutathione S-transferase family protein [Pseudomonadota bacterium]